MKLNDSIILNSAEIALDAAKAPEWVQIAKTGVWRGHPQAPEQRIAESDLAALLDHLDRRFVRNHASVVVDYDHASIFARERGGEMPAPAAAWLDRFELRANGSELWGHVEKWTEKARAAVEAKLYRYLSPVLLYNRPEMGTGQPCPLQLHSVAITNTPFMTDLRALVNSALFQPSGGGGGPGPGQSDPAAKPKEGDMNLLAKLVALGLTAASLGVPEGASDEDVLKAVADKLKAAVANAAIATGLAGVANSLGLPQGAAVDVLNAEVAKLKARAAEAEQKAGGLPLIANALSLPADSDTQKILGAISGLSAAAADTRAEQLVDNAVAAGKIIPANKAFFLERAKADYDRTAQVINSLTPVLSGLATGTAAAPAKAPADPAAAAEAEWVANSVDLAKEGFTKESYVAYRMADAAGLVKQLKK